MVGVGDERRADQVVARFAGRVLAPARRRRRRVRGALVLVRLRFPHAPHRRRLHRAARDRDRADEEQDHHDEQNHVDLLDDFGEHRVVVFVVFALVRRAVHDGLRLLVVAVVAVVSLGELVEELRLLEHKHQQADEAQERHLREHRVEHGPHLGAGRLADGLLRVLEQDRDQHQARDDERHAKCGARLLRHGSEGAARHKLRAVWPNLMREKYGSLDRILILRSVGGRRSAAHCGAGNPPSLSSGRVGARHPVLPLAPCPVLGHGGPQVHKPLDRFLVAMPDRIPGRRLKPSRCESALRTSALHVRAHSER